MIILYGESSVGAFELLQCEHSNYVGRLMKLLSKLNGTIIAALSLVGFLIFSKGFFPTKSVLVGQAGLANQDAFVDDRGAQFDKLIFMVVDAMRSDFMFSQDSQMTFLHHLIDCGNALPFTAYSHPPTVTLPRLKGITTGQIPSFVDAILNIADGNDGSQALTQTDSWISQLRMQSKNKIINFFGDDTWLRLFPAEQYFNQSEGTSLFFVNDFTEVDRNVTRHLDVQLKQPFDALILHYLGLDHIGHTGGPMSVHMKPKQQEMDGILKRLYESIDDQDEQTLIVLMGDHGMNEIGNHGGSSEGETSPGLVLISPKFKRLQASPVGYRGSHKADDFTYYSRIDQIDIVPTLSALLNIPIPKNSVGVMVPQILQCWPAEQQRKKVLLENCEQMFRLFHALHPSKARLFLDQIIRLRNLDASQINEYWEFLRSLKDIMVQNSTNYSLELMYSGLGITFLSAVFLCNLLLRKITHERNSLIHCCFFVGLIVSYCALLHASSFIEEEHQFWWFWAVLAVLLMGLESRSCWTVEVGCLFLLRVIRSWSTMGQKFRLAMTLSDVLVEAPSVLWIVVFVTVYGIPIINGRKEAYKRFHFIIGFMLEIVMSSLTIFLKVLQTKIDGTFLPPICNWMVVKYEDSMDPLLQMRAAATSVSQLFYLAFVTSCLWQLCGRKSVNFTKVSLLLVHVFLHQSRPEILPLFMVFGALETLLSRSDSLKNSEFLLTAIILCIQNLSFFGMGNTNLIATIDLSNAYNGLGSYKISLVGILTFISNFSPSLHWYLAWFRLAEINGSDIRRNIWARDVLVFTFYVTSQASLLASCVNLRYHLFIWSVFCPKVLYFAAWFVLVELGFNVAIWQSFVVLNRPSQSSR